LNITEFLNELKNEAPAFIILKDDIIAKVTWLNPGEANSLFEVLTTTPDIKEKSIKKIVFIYKKMLGLKAFEQFIADNYQKHF
jgi:hypothetical protein